MSTQNLEKRIRQRGGKGLLFCSGAGISAASGIPTFRGNSPDAVWSKDVMTLATRELFEHEPETSWKFYLQRFAGLEGKVPNAAHHALVQIEQYCQQVGWPFFLVTQNIDTLHEKAGSRALIKVHGSSDLVRCARRLCPNGAPAGTLSLSQVDFSEFHQNPKRENVPRCSLCGSFLRPHVLWFDESYAEHEAYRMEDVLIASETFETVVFVGTSFSVGVTAMLLENILLRGQAFSVDPNARSPHRMVEVIQEPAEKLLPALAASLIE